MQRLTMPDRDADADFDTTLAVRKPIAVTVLEGCRGAVLRRYRVYRRTVDSAAIAPMALDVAEKSCLTSNFELTYESRSLRGLRDDVMASASVMNGRCPMCVAGRVSAIDHYLPKSSYPEFAILVDNLIPVCERCNRLKSSESEFHGGEPYCHSYLDAATRVRLLVADIDVGESIAARYRIQDSDSVSKRVLRKYRTHFDRLELERHYSEEAAARLADASEMFAAVHEARGPVGLLRYLRLEHHSRLSRYGPNHWEVALYHGLSRCREFLRGGFQSLVLP